MKVFDESESIGLSLVWRAVIYHCQEAMFMFIVISRSKAWETCNSLLWSLSSSHSILLLHHSQKLSPHNFGILVFVRSWKERHPESTCPQQFILILFLIINHCCPLIPPLFHTFCLYITIFMSYVNLDLKLKATAASKKS